MILGMPASTYTVLHALTSPLRGKAGFVGFAPTAHHDRSAWSFNVELRPFRETR
jgi:hypothetical protein